MQQIAWKYLPDEMWNISHYATQDIEADCLVLKQQLATVKRYLDGIVESVRTREPLSRLNWRHRSVDRSGFPEAKAFADPNEAFQKKRCVTSAGWKLRSQGWENSMVWIESICWRKKTRWWFQTCFCVHPYLGKIPNLTNIFQRGWIHQPENLALSSY